MTTTADIALFSTDYLPNIGGVATHVHELGRALQSLHCHTRVFTVRAETWRHPGTWGSRTMVWDGLTTTQLPFVHLPLDCGQHWSLHRLARHFRNHSLHPPRNLVLHSHDYDTYGHYVAEHSPHAARVFTNHTSMFLQDVADHTTHSRWRRTLALYDWIIAPSQELAEATTALGYPAHRIAVIPNGVDPDRFHPDPLLRRNTREALGIPHGAVVILCARRVVPKNGVIDFAHSLRFLGDSTHPIVVLFAGNQATHDPYERETVAAAMHSPVAEGVHFLGPVPNSDMPRLYAAADMAVLPSLKEATSITGLEAMASALPLVSTNVGGLPDLVEDGVTGVLVHPGDPRAFADAVRQLLGNAGLRSDFGRRGREKVLTHFTWSRIAARTLTVYDTASLIARGRAVSRPDALVAISRASLSPP